MHNNIYNLIESWDTRNLIDILNDKQHSILCKEYVKVFLIKFNLHNKKMCGECTNNVVNEDKLLNICLSYVFHITEYRTQGKFDLIDYLLDVSKFSILKEDDEEQIIYTLCRALRAFPSFLREIDLYEKLKDRLPYIKFNKSLDTDLTHHSDIEFNYNNGTYHIWSYTNTYNGKKKLLRKLIGTRGDIPNGIHLLIPFDFNDTEDINGWKLYGNSTINNALCILNNGRHFIDYNSINYNTDINIFSRPLCIKK